MDLVSRVGNAGQKKGGSSHVANIENQITVNSVNMESWITENSTNMESQIMEDSANTETRLWKIRLTWKAGL
jgi:hypothetical protein